MRGGRGKEGAQFGVGCEGGGIIFLFWHLNLLHHQVSFVNSSFAKTTHAVKAVVVGLQRATPPRPSRASSFSRRPWRSWSRPSACSG